jgi:hypothetical protein
MEPRLQLTSGCVLCTIHCANLVALTVLLSASNDALSSPWRDQGTRRLADIQFVRGGTRDR